MGFKFSPFNLNPFDIELGNGFVFDPFEDEKDEKDSSKEKKNKEGEKENK